MGSEGDTATWLAGESEADRLLTDDPLALVIGMLLDQQVPIERAFRAPLELSTRLQSLGLVFDASAIASTDPEQLAALFVTPPALHRYPGAMAQRVHDLCRLIVENYDGRADAIWNGAETGAKLRTRVAALPGFGPQKAQIFVALLGKQRGVRPEGWREAAGAFGLEGTYRSVADVTDEQSLARVREFKKAAKAAARESAT